MSGHVIERWNIRQIENVEHEMMKKKFVEFEINALMIFVKNNDFF